MPSGCTKNFPESSRGLGHVTPTIFGSTVGYPSDSLASCCLNLHTTLGDMEENVSGFFFWTQCINGCCTVQDANSQRNTSTCQSRDTRRHCTLYSCQCQSRRQLAELTANNKLSVSLIHQLLRLPSLRSDVNRLSILTASQTSWGNK